MSERNGHENGHREEAALARVEADLNNLIEKRALQARDAEEEDVRWQTSVRRFYTERYHSRCEEWALYHEEQVLRITVTSEALVDKHRQQAEKYRRMIATGVVPQGDLGLRPGNAPTWH